MAVPQTPFTARLALQEAVTPVFAPVHDQLHGPDPETAVGVPAAQKLVVGAEYKLDPLETPQTPSIFKFALHEALLPPLVAKHVQDHGPEPETDEELPTLHRLPVGAEYTLDPLELPQAPLTDRLALQEAVLPPFMPLQDQDHGPEPETAV